LPDPGQKGRLGGPGWETGTKGVFQPEQHACSVVVFADEVGWPALISMTTEAFLTAETFFRFGDANTHGDSVCGSRKGTLRPCRRTRANKSFGIGC